MPSSVALQIDAFVGTYQGPLILTVSPSASFSEEMVDPQFRLQLTRQESRPVLTAMRDILGSRCHSKIGPLKSLQVGGAWDAIAVFAFDPGQCENLAAGREVIFYVNRTGQALFSFTEQAGVRLGARSVGKSELEANLYKL